MKKYYAIIAAASLVAVAQTVSAQTTIFSDNFTAPDGFPGNQDLNIDANSTRLGGTIAPSLYGPVGGDGTIWIGNGGQHQLGNTTTDVGQPNISDGNYALLSGSGMQSTFDVTSLAAGPITISFDMYNTKATGQWGAFSLATSGGYGNPVAGANQFGFLQRDNGGVQVFQNGSNVAGTGSWDTGSFASSPLWTLTFSDTPGTGSAFDNNGSVVTIMNGANTLGTLTLGQNLDTSGLYLYFYNSGNVSGVDNVLITTPVTPVPEPSTFALAAAGLGCLSLVRRYRRA
jgi:hypothetical protein